MNFFRLLCDLLFNFFDHFRLTVATERRPMRAGRNALCKKLASRLASPVLGY